MNLIDKIKTKRKQQGIELYAIIDGQRFQLGAISELSINMKPSSNIYPYERTNIDPSLNGLISTIDNYHWATTIGPSWEVSTHGHN